MKTKIFIAIPNLGNIRTQLVRRVLMWAKNPAYQVEVWMPEDLVPLDYARNVIRKRFLEEKFDFLLTIDADVVPPVDILSLVDLKLDVVAPVCYVLKEDGIIPMALKRVDDGWQVVGDLVAGKIYPVDCAGAGCLMISRKVLEKVPLFRFTYDNDGMLLYDEGFSWSDEVNKAGFTMFVHAGMICDHYKTVNLTDLVALQNKQRAQEKIKGALSETISDSTPNYDN